MTPTIYVIEICLKQNKKCWFSNLYVLLYKLVGMRHVWENQGSSNNKHMLKVVRKITTYIRIHAWPIKNLNLNLWRCILAPTSWGDMTPDHMTTNFHLTLVKLFPHVRNLTSTRRLFLVSNLTSVTWRPPDVYF